MTFTTASGAQQGAPASVLQLPPAAHRTSNLPLRDVQTSYSPAGKRPSPQDGFVIQQKPSGNTPRDADGHPDLSGTYVRRVVPTPLRLEEAPQCDERDFKLLADPYLRG
jgi:hypothetical protein